MPIQPNPRTWTLKFKHHKTTIVLHVDPLQTFTSIKAELLKAISDSHSSRSLNGSAIPKNPNEILLAKPLEPNDLSLGWQQIILSNEDGDDDGDSTGKGKGKAGVVTGRAPAKNQLKECPQGAGLREGSIVAFKFKNDEEMNGPSNDGVDDEIAVAEEDMSRQMWDVVVPTMENTYGDTMEEDIGDEGAVV